MSYKEIKVKNHTILVDEEDYPLVSRYKWTVRLSYYVYYATTNVWINKKWTLLGMHRLVMGINKLPVDHRNGNGLDNRKTNLRMATAAQNRTNSRLGRNNKSGFRGVTSPMKAPKKKPWYAICARRRLGYFATKEDAARAYDAAAKEIFGEFAVLNFKDTIDGNDSIQNNSRS